MAAGRKNVSLSICSCRTGPLRRVLMYFDQNRSVFKRLEWVCGVLSFFVWTYASYDVDVSGAF